jgi:pimeloyl-ACP methyl ester carboxylesterase
VQEPASPEVKLATSVIEGSGATATRDLYMLHGIYGRGRNWSAIARRLTAVRDDWRAVLVDLRGHGESPVPPGPHTINHAARDVARVALARRHPVSAILGHSFGGKVALAYAAVSPPDLQQLWLIDSTPAPKTPDGTAWTMLGLVRTHRGPFPSRREAANALEEGGIAPDVAAWMATNVGWREGAYHWRIDVEVMEALLHDFFRQDFWHVIESPPEGVTIHIVKATQSSLLGPEACRRIEAAHSDHGQVHLHRVHGGHWIHTDHPEAVTELLARELPLRTSRQG